MKEVWVLSVRTSLPKICYNANSLTTTFHAFENFESAKNAFRAKLKEFAFSKNKIFDGSGHIKNLKAYLKDMPTQEKDDEEFGILTNRIVSQIQEGLCSAFEGNDVSLKIKKKKYDDGSISVKISSSEISFEGVDDLNGYDPVVRTNFLNMDKEQDYYFYVNPLFGYQDDGTAELYVDLKKVTLNT